jgi:hypothetical protein
MMMNMVAQKPFGTFFMEILQTVSLPKAKRRVRHPAQTASELLASELIGTLLMGTPGLMMIALSVGCPHDH